jgi:predicted AAA+ superfamily ATPase
MNLQDYAHEIFTSGFPGIRNHSDKGISALLGGYIDAVVNREFAELGVRVRKPNVLRAWLAAYAAATATTTSYAKILRASTPGEDKKPGKDATLVYRDTLDSLYLTDRVDPWLPTTNRLTALGRSQKHFLVDPALALSLLKIRKQELLTSTQQLEVGTSRDNSVFGRLFESLAASSLKVYAQSADANLYHLRTSDGRHEVDFIVERGSELLGIEVKLDTQITSADGNQLRWLKEQLDGSRRLTQLIVYAGTHAYKRSDGILVVPLALLGA